jgi:hypothetical protein
VLVDEARIVARVRERVRAQLVVGVILRHDRLVRTF